MGKSNVLINGRVPKNSYFSGDIPEGRFNPYDHIDVSNYKLNRRGKAEYAHDLAELQYFAQLRQQDYERDYNSESAQALRMRLAGLNPDLQGVNQGSSGETPSISSNAMEGIPTNGERASSVIGNITSIISTVASLASSAIGITQGLSGIQGSSLANMSSAMNVADTAFGIFDKWSAGNPEGFAEFVDNIPLLSRNQRRQVERMYNHWSVSPYMDKSHMKFESEIMDATGEFYKRAVNPKYNSKEVGDYYKAWTPLVESLNDLAVKEARAGIKKADYEMGYHSESLGTSMANKEKNQNELFSSIRKPLLDVLNNFESMMKNSDPSSMDYKVGLYSRAFLSGMILKMFAGM